MPCPATRQVRQVGHQRPGQGYRALERPWL